MNTCTNCERQAEHELRVDAELRHELERRRVVLAIISERWHSRMSDRSNHRVAAGQSNSSSVSIFQVSCLATNVAPASWSKPAAWSSVLSPPSNDASSS